MYKVKGKKVLVVGLGKTGESSARFLMQQGAKVTATDSKNKNELTEVLRNLADLKIDYELGKINPKLFTSHELIVLSPGVPSNTEGLSDARAAGIPVINDLELAFEHIKAPIIAVTGTNGKTTTTTMIGDMLKNDGKKVFVGGNIGVPVLEHVMRNEEVDYVILEVSSFQAEVLENFKPAVAVFTNLEPDHLDRYPQGIESYYAAKRRILKNSDANTVLVSNLDNDGTASMAGTFPGKVYRFTKRNPMAVNPTSTEQFFGAYLQKPKMVIRLSGSDEEYNLMTMKLPGDHNRENLMAAACAAKALGCSRVGIQKTIETFKGVAHRLEFVRKKDGVYFYNDSKGTNVSSVIRALSSFSVPVILIAGGKDKDQDFAPLVDLVRKRVKNLILLGEAKEKVNRAIGDFSETFLVGTFEEAILIAFQKSRNGDVILLSPGCASYDMFKNYEERGDYFKKLVTQL